MSSFIKRIPGGITAPLGFLAGAVFCDIKRLGTGKGSNKGKKKDLALIVSETPAVAAGLFTTNQVCAAPVKVCLDHLTTPLCRAIVVNSGNANACTGPRGKIDARAMCALTATALARSNPVLHSAGLKLASGARSVLVASTGRIGVELPMKNLKAGIKAAAQSLGKTSEHSDQVAEAIMTSDTRPKQTAVSFSIEGTNYRLGGVCKGAGMIQPGMSLTGQRPPAQPHATMLGFLTTDLAIEPPLLSAALEKAVASSFNRITVDGDMSTNDTVLILANGQAGGKLISSKGRALELFQKALDLVCLELAQMIVRDGEGVTRFITVRVTGAQNRVEADAVARSVANSTLVKTSWFGGDPNWGRILDAVGYSPATIQEEKVDLAYSEPGSSKRIYSLRHGRPTRTPFRTLCRLVARKEFELHIDLHLGPGKAVIYTSDLTEDYVDFNKGDVSDPASLGG